MTFVTILLIVFLVVVLTIAGSIALHKADPGIQPDPSIEIDPRNSYSIAGINRRNLTARDIGAYPAGWKLSP